MEKEGWGLLAVLMTASHFIQKPQEVNDYSLRPGSQRASPGVPLPGEVMLMAFFANSSPPPVSYRIKEPLCLDTQELWGFPEPVFACLLCCLTWRLHQQSVWWVLRAKAMQRSDPVSLCLLLKVFFCSLWAPVTIAPSCPQESLDSALFRAPRNLLVLTAPPFSSSSS